MTERNLLQVQNASVGPTHRSKPIRYAASRFTERCRDAGALREIEIGDGAAMAIRMKPCFDLGIAPLREDLHFFLASPPDYSAEKLPRV